MDVAAVNLFRRITRARVANMRFVALVNKADY